ncbi:hypothetical protein [Deinococcus soli (ex Cha et al. 2016)]|uniref:Uncharacterized protein n=2 Tax=Deinococcus soli (ex Cha et al. 2016) TaxID=1309411 RepID=A0ACC6KGQ9_9DEIO|nr:hypothetical protein [Deinococcus soli (ex Cha et al. 2016)]MDR6219039.1 hypothetical protein [Deinococcus soli (ex Cha et al. 2016)]MDR6328836.1 hypothetical protein [Deinococcus soli (ex Cha et al. 2016)]MDR6751676.1 hypothetical protein [Deinococcus soli (ex Cha et al. 2016)]
MILAPTSVQAVTSFRTAPLLALTLLHPWPFAITRLGKNIENRSWAPPPWLIGRLIAIHGGAVPGGMKLEETIASAQWIATELMRSGRAKPYLTPAQWTWLRAQQRTLTVGDMITPGIVAIARVTGCVTSSDNPWFSGPFGWTLEDVTPIDAVPCRGKQKLWIPEPRTEVQVAAAYLRATQQPAPWRGNEDGARGLG